MVDFRRCITALAILTLFVGLAAAQTGVQTPFQCSTNVTVTPQLRGEGYTEQTGDITLTCTGGTAPATGTLIPQVNITVFYNSQVTSRLIPITGSSQVSEALLLIDEPGSGLTPVVAGFGPAAPQNLCSTPLTGCAEYVLPLSTGTGSVFVSTDSPTATAAGRNIFQGVVTGNSVTFFGIPILAPGTTASRVFRITNVRVNATTLSGGSASGASPVTASISISGATSVLISNSTPNVGFVQPGLTATASGNTALNQCSTQTRTSVNTLKFTENFGTAFKTRVVASSNGAYAAQGSTSTQNVPGNIYNSESNFVLPVPNGTAGLADFGTRLKAVFNNVPSNVRIFVSTANVLNSNLIVVAPSPIGGSATTPAYAQLVTGESIADGSVVGSGNFPAVSPLSDLAPGSSGGTVPIAEIPITAGSGTAVWEVTNTASNTIESISFAVYATYTANVSSNSPPASQSTVSLSFAPTPPSFTASTGSVASSTLTIPRFQQDSSAARNTFLVQVCRTILLYPYVTNQAGFDTGLEIANTSQDPFTLGSSATAAQAGSCTLTWYGGTTAAPTTPPGPSTTGSIAGGAIWVNTAQALVPNFQGYMIAVCNFQYAHGIAFVSDVGARNFAMGYLAIVLPDPGTSARPAQPGGCIGVSGCNTGGEQDAH